MLNLILQLISHWSLQFGQVLNKHFTLLRVPHTYGALYEDVGAGAVEIPQRAHILSLGTV